MVNQERLAIVRTLPIRPAGYLHLENAEVDPELQFLPPVQPDNLAHFDRASFVRPILEQRIEIKTHYVNNVRNSLLFVNRRSVKKAIHIVWTSARTLHSQNLRPHISLVTRPSPFVTGPGGTGD